jgi:fatty-acyl-CoA synthase
MQPRRGNMNVGEWPARWAKRYPEEPCMKYGELELTKGDFNRRVNRLSHALLGSGIHKGDRVAVLMGNSHVFLEILFAVSKLGAIMVPLNFRLSPAELEFILNDSEPVLLIYSPEFISIVDALRDKVPSLKRLVSELQGGPQQDLEYESWVSDKSDQEPAPESEVTFDDPHFIMYTSGTTGKPKGAVITQGNTQWNVINGATTYGIGNQDVMICSAPLFHVGALNVSATPALYSGLKLVIQRFFDPSEVLRLIEQEKVSIMFGIPVMFLFMTYVPEFSSTDFSSVRFFIAGGSPCPRSLMETYMERGVAFNQGYGMTETAPGITALRTEDSLRKLGSCGKPLLHTDVKVMDNTGRELSPGETGEVLVKGPNVMKEYWRRPDATAETIVDGWLHTGDMGYFDEEGYLFLMDRKKDMYISGGENVYPAEVEDAIMRFDKVAEVGVIGISDEKWGEVGLAIVVPHKDMEVKEEEIIEFCRSKLAKYKIPKKVVFAESLPRTLTGKILKKDLKATYGHLRAN